MSLDDDWKKLCSAYIDADFDERSTWWVILTKYQAIANGISTEKPTEAQMTAHLIARQTLNAVKNRMEVFITPLFSNEVSAKE